MKKVAVSGYFDPLHVGHVEYLEMASRLGDYLVIILNNDRQALKKKPKVFMPLEQRKKILEAIKWVDEVYVSIDEDETVCHSLQVVKPDIFAKGGDRFIEEIPEAKTCRKLKIKMIDNLGYKIQASSELMKKWEK